jgi:DNA-binding transcriptional LysR family regulator
MSLKNGTSAKTSALSLIETFLLLSAELSFTRVAEKLGTTQPRVSLIIRKLEKELGFELFSRTSRRVTLTPEGMAFLPAARNVVGAVADAEHLARRLGDQRHRRLKMGAALFTARIRKRTELLDRFLNEHPHVELEIHSAPSDELLPRLRDGEIDVMFATLPLGPSDDLEICSVARAVAHIGAPPNHPFAAMTSIPVAALKSRKVVVLPRLIGDLRFQAWYRPLFEAGAQMIEAPEAANLSLLHYAESRQLPVFGHLWPQPVETGNAFVWRELVPNTYVDLVLVRLRSSVSHPAASELFWKCACQIGDYA